MCDRCVLPEAARRPDELLGPFFFSWPVRLVPWWLEVAALTTLLEKVVRMLVRRGKAVRWRLVVFLVEYLSRPSART